jgi:Tfp pilus assembly pilus retraction ATPase PilT
VFRTILSKILTLQEPGDLKSFAEMTRKPRRLILVTGSTGS